MYKTDDEGDSFFCTASKLQGLQRHNWEGDGQPVHEHRRDRHHWFHQDRDIWIARQNLDTGQFFETSSFLSKFHHVHIYLAVRALITSYMPFHVILCASDLQGERAGANVEWHREGSFSDHRLQGVPHRHHRALCGPDDRREAEGGGSCRPP